LTESLVEGNKYSKEIFKAIEKEMLPQDKAFAESQLEIYREHYDKVNEVFKELYGVNLPFNEFYSPIRREGFKVDHQKGMGEFMSEASHRSGLRSNFSKTRTKNSLPLEQTGSISTMQKHMTETNYFIAWGKQIRDFNAVFKDPEVRAAIKDQLGGNLIKVIDTSIEHMTTNGNKTANWYNGVDAFRKMHTIGSLSWKPLIAAKQMVSTLAYMEKVNPVEFAVGVADFFKNPVKNYRTLVKESALISTRGENIERDIKAAADEFKGKNRVLDSYINIAMANVKIGDKGAIVLGSWALRKARLKQGGKLKEIINEYEEFSSSTQQSSDISRLSQLQRGGSMDRLFTMYKSSPRQYLQKELEATKSLFQKDGLSRANIGKFARTMFVYHIMLPFAFQYMANLGGWSEDDKKDYMRSVTMGSVNGAFILGDVVTSLLRVAAGQYVFDNELPIYQLSSDIVDAVGKIDFEDITTEDMMEAVYELSDAGNSVGIPVKQAKSLGGAAVDISNGSTKEGIAGLMMYSDYRIEANLGGSDKKKSKSKKKYDLSKYK